MRNPLLGSAAAASAALLFSCTAPVRDIVKIKVFALTPDNYLDKNVSIQGRIVSTTPSNAGFLLADDSGSVFVSTELSADKFLCPIDANAFVEGFLRQNSSIGQTYFMMTAVHECQTTSANESRK